jgi:hypothetical protein
MVRWREQLRTNLWHLRRSLDLAANLADIRFNIAVPPVCTSRRLGTFPITGGKVFFFNDTYGLSIRRCHARTSSIWRFAKIPIFPRIAVAFSFPQKRAILPEELLVRRSCGWRCIE